jgi:hypothetical protein
MGRLWWGDQALHVALTDRIHPETPALGWEGWGRKALSIGVCKE